VSVSKLRLAAVGLAAAGAVALGWATNVGQTLRSDLQTSAAGIVSGNSEVSGDRGAIRVAEREEPSKRTDSPVRVDAPGTQVDVDKERGKVSVTAPHTDVHVDPDKGRVQVRAPYVNLDIRW
jgi:ferric-dicitrate binding protein FerR (iron transport regulator)